MDEKCIIGVSCVTKTRSEGEMAYAVGVRNVISNQYSCLYLLSIQLLVVLHKLARALFSFVVFLSS